MSSDWNRFEPWPANTVRLPLRVIGVQMAEICSVPPNLKFVIDDAEDLWVYQEKFDFIHARLMAGCFADWPNFFRQAYQ